MKTYLVDTNVWLRLLVGDVPEQKSEAEKVMHLAQLGEAKLVLCAEVVMEMVFALLKFYNKPRMEVAEKLCLLLSAPYVEVVEREVLLRATKLFGATNFDFVDLLLHERAKEAGMKVLSFDDDLKKLKKLEEN